MSARIDSASRFKKVDSGRGGGGGRGGANGPKWESERAVCALVCVRVIMSGGWSEGERCKTRTRTQDI